MPKIPHSNQTAAISAIWRYPSIAGNTSTQHCTLGGSITHNVCQLCKTNPFYRTMNGYISLQPQIPQTPPPTPSRLRQKIAVKTGFLTGNWITIPGMSARTYRFSLSSPMPKPSGFRHSPSFIRRGLGGGIQYFPIHFRKPAQLTHSKMKNKPIFSHYQPPQPLTPIPPLQHSAKPLPFLNGFVETALRSSGSTTGFDLPEKYETALALASIYNPAVLHYMTLKGLPCTVRPLTYANG